ncbi:tRNA adenosine deaminase-associated protein [Nocardioides jensenii]|uniref:tRNA adenosine deaminase-associated protein n=1 Tax=Nocardioides jensenii TaxID=1843 RepID=UPI00082FBC86|nr:tRNA adenosine deaminase-associated protein [Nocardioides jensenii]
MVEELEIDFALAAYREEGDWQLQELADVALTDLETLAAGLRRFPGDGGTIALIGFDEDVFLIVRVTGPTVRVLLSDITAADEWDLARGAIELLGLPYPEEADESAPAGDLDILGDLGMHAMDMGVLIDDYDLYPDEMLSDVAGRLGFGPAFDDAVDLTTA